MGFFLDEKLSGISPSARNAYIWIVVQHFSHPRHGFEEKGFVNHLPAEKVQMIDVVRPPDVDPDKNRPGKVEAGAEVGQIPGRVTLDSKNKMHRIYFTFYCMP